MTQDTFSAAEILTLSNLGVMAKVGRLCGLLMIETSIHEIHTGLHELLHVLSQHFTEEEALIVTPSAKENAHLLLHAAIMEELRRLHDTLDAKDVDWDRTMMRQIYRMVAAEGEMDGLLENSMRKEK